MFKPGHGIKWELESILEGTHTDGEAKFNFTWEGDLDPKLTEQHAVLDNRLKTIEKCSEWNNLETKIKNNKATFTFDSTVPHDTWEDIGCKEIFACMRA